MTRAMKVTIGVEVSEEEVKEWLKNIGSNPEEINDDDYLEYVEVKYGIGLGAEASFC